MPKTPKAINLYKGLSIYRVAGSSKWYVRVWDRKKKKYLVKSTGKDSSIEAKDVAQEFAMALLKSEPRVCLSPLELCQYILAKGVRKHGSEAIF